MCKLAFVPRVVSHERSSPGVGGGLNAREGVGVLNLEGDCEGV